MPQPKQPQQESQEAGTKEYVLDSKSTSEEVSVDKKTLAKGGKPVALTQDEYDRVSALDGVKLTEASKETEE